MGFPVGAGGKGRGGGGGDGDEGTGKDDEWRRIRDWMRRGQQAEVIAYCLGVLGLYLVAAIVAMHTWCAHPHIRTSAPRPPLPI